jgi:hypothetical protein
MFIFIGKDIVNVNHIIRCFPGNGVTTIHLTDGKVYNIPTSQFEEEVAPFLPMAKKQAKKKEAE